MVASVTEAERALYRAYIKSYLLTGCFLFRNCFLVFPAVGQLVEMVTTRMEIHSVKK